MCYSLPVGFHRAPLTWRVSRAFDRGESPSLSVCFSGASRVPSQTPQWVSSIDLLRVTWLCATIHSVSQSLLKLLDLNQHILHASSCSSLILFTDVIHFILLRFIRIPYFTLINLLLKCIKMHWLVCSYYQNVIDHILLLLPVDIIFILLKLHMTPAYF